jgi:(R,R)-butanediol dehydrogenase/meso-butanediol dehydrogenase/diacetyl reductase
MKAARYEGKKKITIVDIPKPIPQKDEVLVRVKYTGICGSDLEGYKTGLYPANIIMGHEIMGYITEIGRDVKNWKEGDRVAVFSSLACGKCYFCQRGQDNLCIHEGALGFGQYGGYSEYVPVKSEYIFTLPVEIPDKHGTVFDQLGTALLALRESDFVSENYAVVLGCGTMGLFLLQYLKVAGAKPIVVVERNPYRLDVAQKFGPDLVLNEVKLVKIRRFARREFGGADYVFECSGVPVLVNNAINIARKGGTVVQIGVWDKPLEINLLKYVMNQIRIQPAWSCTREDFIKSIDLIAKKLINPDPIVTKIISLDDIVDEGFECGIDPDTSEIKILVEP